jgi:hypothetical protein
VGQIVTQIIELQRQLEGEGFYLHFIGGFRAAKIHEDAWQIEPVFVNDKPCATGPLTMAQLQALSKQNNFRAIAFHRFGWMDGEYYSSWAPIIPGNANHSEGPADRWSSIASNIARSRTKEFFETAEHPEKEQIAKALDNQNPVEALARYIALSLRSMDISVEQIAEHYHEQLVNHMAKGRVGGELAANTLSQTLYAHVHSFFLHLGATRDYLGALIAHRIGLDYKKIDSMARLVGELRQANLPKDALLDLLIKDGDIAAHPQKQDKLAVAGWMQEVTEIRNELVHKRPYGSKFNESFGRVIPAQKEAGLYRYFRPLDLNGSADQDVFDVLHHHYARCTDLMHKAAKASGNNAAMMHVTNDDVIALKIRRGGEESGEN